MAISGSASLLAGMAYGVLLEHMAIVTFHAYAYGRFLVMLFGLLADRISESRRLMEEILYRVRRDEAASPDRATPPERPGH